MAVVEVAGTSYHIDDRMKKLWDRLKDGYMVKHDEDRWYITDGREGSGKSLYTIQQAAYIDPSIVTDLSRICFSAEEFLSAVRKAQPGSVVIFDEAFRGLSSRAALSKVNRRIIQTLMEVRQKNLIVFIVSPSIFLLEKYLAIVRSNALFHIVKNKKHNYRTFRVFNHKKKAKLYLLGLTKGWEYGVKTKFRGKFFGKWPGGDVFEKAYREKKLKSLVESESEGDEPAEDNKYMIQRDLMIAGLYFKKKMSQMDIAEWLNTLGLTVSRQNVTYICQKHRSLRENGQLPMANI